MLIEIVQLFVVFRIHNRHPSTVGFVGDLERFPQQLLAKKQPHSVNLLGDDLAELRGPLPDEPHVDAHYLIRVAVQCADEEFGLLHLRVLQPKTRRH